MLEGQFSLFDAAQAATTGTAVAWPNIPEYDSRLLMAMEKEMLGLYLTGHPLDSVSDLILRHATVTSRDFQPPLEGEIVATVIQDGQPLIAAGLITEMKSISTRSNKMMAFLTVEDLYGQFEVIVFPNVLETQAAMLVRDTAVWVEGRASVKEDEEPKILAERFLPLAADSPLPGLPGRSRNGGSGRGFPKPAGGDRDTRPYPNRSVTSQSPGTSGQMPEASGQLSGTSGQLSGTSSQNPAASSMRPGTAQQPVSDDTIRLKLRIPDTLTQQESAAVEALLQYFEGHTPAHVYENGTKTPSRKVLVDAGPVLYRALLRLVGEQNVKLEASEPVR